MLDWKTCLKKYGAQLATGRSAWTPEWYGVPNSWLVVLHLQSKWGMHVGTLEIKAQIKCKDKQHITQLLPFNGPCLPAQSRASRKWKGAPKRKNRRKKTQNFLCKNVPLSLKRAFFSFEAHPSQSRFGTLTSIIFCKEKCLLVLSKRKIFVKIIFKAMHKYQMKKCCHEIPMQ